MSAGMPTRGYRGSVWKVERPGPAMAPLELAAGKAPAPASSPVRQAAEAWQALGCPAGLLWRDEALAQAERWAATHPAEVGEVESDFLQACREAERGLEREGHWGSLLRGMAALALAGLLVALGAWWTTRQESASLAAAKAKAEQQAAGAAAQVSETAQVVATLVAVTESFSAAQEELKEEKHWLERQIGVERALKLAAQSQAALAEDRDLALLLAVEAARRLAAWNRSGAAADQVAAALYRALGHPGWRVWQSPAGLEAAARRSTPAWAAPDGQRLLSATPEGRLGLWDVATGAQLVELEGGGAISLAAWSPDGRRVAAVSAGGQELAAWDQGGARLWQLSAGALHYQDLVWSPDGAWLLAVRDAEMVLIEGEGGREAAVWRSALLAEGAPPALQWSSDGRRLAVATELGVEAYDLATGACLAAPHAATDYAAAGNALPGATARWDEGGERAMLADLDAAVALACGLVRRELTPAERASYLGAEADYRDTCTRPKLAE